MQCIHYRCESSLLYPLFPFPFPVLQQRRLQIPKVKWVTIGIIKTKILRMHPISMFREMLSEPSHWMHLPMAGLHTGPTLKLMLTRNPNSTSVQVRFYTYIGFLLTSVICIPMECPDGPAAPHLLLFPGPHHHNILENKWENFCPCAGVHMI